MPGGVGADTRLYAVPARVITLEQQQQIVAELRRVSAAGVSAEEKLQVCDWAAREYGDAYFRTRSGALQRVFPKAMKIGKLGDRRRDGAASTN